MSYLLGRKIAFLGWPTTTDQPRPKKTGRVIHMDKHGWWIELEGNRKLACINPFDSAIHFAEPVHPQGLRPVVFTCSELYEGEQQGWLVAIHPHEEDCTGAVVEGPDGQIMVLYAQALRFIDRDHSHASGNAAPSDRT